ncbi:MAG: beta-propeller domain-containing protein [Oscillospiraceae bacterium]|jgi:uncharacterized secreted protein with C-terminal beta-propeller domain|nr:beta-propeller domain-containing protein [Oscillospiraceae bacterium]
MKSNDIRTTKRLRREFRAALENTEIPPEISTEKTAERILWEQAQHPQRRKIHWKKPVISAVAAVLALSVALGVALYSTGLPLTPVKPPAWVDNTAADNERAVHPKSAEELEALFRWFKEGADGTAWDALRESFGGIFNGAFAQYGPIYGMFQNNLKAEMAPASPSSPGMEDSALSRESESVGQTNTQVDGIDEQDIIKNSGKTLFIAQPGHVSGSDENETVTVGVRRVQLLSGGKMKEISPVIIYQGWRYVGDSEEIVGIFLHEGKLIVISQTQGYFLHLSKYAEESWVSPVQGGTQKLRTIVRVYSDADGENPKLLSSSAQDGQHLSSRLYGGRLTVATSSAVQVWSEGFEPSRDMYPQITKDGVTANLPLEKIYSTVNNSTPSYLVISNTDLNAAAPTTEHCAVLGAGENLYCSGDTLYIGRSIYGEKTETEIFKFALDGKPRLLGSGTVPGTALNQFSMDEYNGNLRIATQGVSGSGGDKITAENSALIPADPADNNIIANAVYVLDGNLKTIGKLENIAPGETIQSVRFVGATGYVVTFLQTDPLFVLDLADAKKPKLVGELKIPGFSSYLHPVADGWLLGVGVPGDANGTIGGVKLSLFDVRNPKKPVEADSVVFSGYQYGTNATNDHRAFFVYPDEGLFGLPISNETDGSGGVSISAAALYTYRVKDGKIVRAGVYGGEALSYRWDETPYSWYGTDLLGSRATYVGSTIYTRLDGILTSFDLSDAKQLAKLDMRKDTLPDAPKPETSPPIVDQPTNSPEEITESPTQSGASEPYNPGAAGQ